MQPEIGRFGSKNMKTRAVDSQATYSECGQYRYFLRRDYWHAPEAHETVNFLMMNPSTATEEFNDPTLARCEDYALRWGYDATRLPLACSICHATSMTVYYSLSYESVMAKCRKCGEEYEV